MNVASRLEGSTKFFGVDIAANGATRNEAPELAWLEIDQVLVKGKTIPIDVYMLVGDEKVAASEAFKRHESVHKEMLAAFRARKFGRAVALAEESETLASDEIRGIYNFYRGRFGEYVAVPPGEDWSPILKLEEK